MSEPVSVEEPELVFLQGTIVLHPVAGVTGRVLSDSEHLVEIIVTEPASARGRTFQYPPGELEIIKDAVQVWTECFGSELIDEDNLRDSLQALTTVKVKKKPRGATSLKDKLAAALRSGDVDEQERLLKLMQEEK